jgi:hypothetical protein
MTKQELSNLTDEELLAEKKKMKKSKLFHALWIGFLAGIIAFGMIAWAMNPERKIGFLIPMIFPIFFIYRHLKTPNPHKDLEDVLKERKL